MRDHAMRERVAQEMKQQVILNNELDHRVKNTLASVLSLVGQSARGSKDVPDFEERLTGRIRAMATTHEALAVARWEGLALHELTELVLGHLKPHAPERTRLKGGNAYLNAYTTAPLGLAFNELATNALKYGAWAHEGGALDVSWHITDEKRLQIDWVETGVPGMQDEPRREGGLGLKLVKGMIEFQLHGEIHLDFTEQGLTARIVLGSDALAPAQKTNLADTATSELMELEQVGLTT